MNPPSINSVYLVLQKKYYKSTQDQDHMPPGTQYYIFYQNFKS